ncbi:MAG: M23 family metallopeptidase [Clostridia bacterium]|nr:M23 family metallopeptidase [Clostridia bacterium]
MKSIRKQERFKKGIYSVCAFSLCVILLLSLWISNKDNQKTDLPENSTSNTETQTQKNDVHVNTPVTNVPDTRDESTTEEKTVISFVFPLNNKVTKAFSNGEIVRNATTGDWKTHNGVDISGNQGDEIHAVGDGVVTELTHHELWGTVVTIDHHNGFIAKYSGLQRDETVQPGDEISKNQKIGVLGEIPIEKADGFHLHFELTKNGKYVSPNTYLGKEVEI